MRTARYGSYNGNITTQKDRADEKPKNEKSSHLVNIILGQNGTPELKRTFSTLDVRRVINTPNGIVPAFGHFISSKQN